MSDALITAAELASHLRIPLADLDTSAAALHIAAATGAVQAAAGQRLIQATDNATLLGTCSQWLTLPERPVTAVSAVTVDGSAVTDFTSYADRLWRGLGWHPWPAGPVTFRPPYSTVVVTYTHGWPVDHRKLELARSVVFDLAGEAQANPSKLEAVAIGDYRESHGNVAARVGMVVTPEQRRELRRTYGQIVGTVRTRP